VNLVRKITKRGLIKKLDKAFSGLIRKRGVCARCRKGAEETTLQCAHIIGRRNFAVRWDIDNGIPLCYACHIFWAHKEPIWFNDFARDYLGRYKFEQLKLRARKICKWTIPEMQSLLTNLQKEAL
jgi:hypothetical protein